MVDVKQALPRASNGTNQQPWTNKIFVGGLPDDLTEEEFRSYFEDFGTVTDAVVIYDKHTCRPRGFGFVTFDSYDVALNVLKQNSYELKSKTVEVKRAEPKDMNDKHMNLYDCYNTDLDLGYYGGYSYNTYSPYFSFPGYYNWSPSGYYASHVVHHHYVNPSVLYTSHNYGGYTNHRATYNGNSNGDNDRGRVKVTTSAKLQLIDHSSSPKSGDVEPQIEEIDDSSCPKWSIAEQETEIDNSSSPKSSASEPQIGEIDGSSQAKNNEVQNGGDGSCSNNSSSPKSNASDPQLGEIDDTEVQNGADGSCSNHHTEDHHSEEKL
ncbi:hypothetical protein JRO89_XS08G0223500 [Xanthoceras sorbifolium]|uniref:RRM domain-containing protein n=1 Tax=Xanthoceras sorbifolium TaxID=99658 RepID=A0ABQ8HQX5_9ROSI|nr:hypothetical protein JRO89_XS08G0223500 [Xanthoceras sorbifolium]